MASKKCFNVKKFLYIYFVHFVHLFLATIFKLLGVAVWSWETEPKLKFPFFFEPFPYIKQDGHFICLACEAYYQSNKGIHHHLTNKSFGFGEAHTDKKSLQGHYVRAKGKYSCSKCSSEFAHYVGFWRHLKKWGWSWNWIKFKWRMKLIRDQFRKKKEWEWNKKGNLNQNWYQKRQKSPRRNGWISKGNHVSPNTRIFLSRKEPTLSVSLVTHTTRACTGSIVILK